MRLEAALLHRAARGATHVIANRLEMKDRIATGKLMRPVVAGPGKAVLNHRGTRYSIGY